MHFPCLFSDLLSWLMRSMRYLIFFVFPRELKNSDLTLLRPLRYCSVLGRCFLFQSYSWSLMDSRWETIITNNAVTHDSQGYSYIDNDLKNIARFSETQAPSSSCHPVLISLMSAYSVGHTAVPNALMHQGAIVVGGQSLKIYLIIHAIIHTITAWSHRSVNATLKISTTQWARVSNHRYI